MGLLDKKIEIQVKKDDGNQKRQTIFVGFSSKKAIFLINGEVKEYKYSYGIPIIPLHGFYYSYKDKRKYSSEELRDYYVVVFIPKSISKETLEDLKTSKVVVAGYYSNQIFVDEPDDQEEGKPESQGEKDGTAKKE